jgi:gamma-glutamyltranspeptidase/glutathione hydrolase
MLEQGGNAVDAAVAAAAVLGVTEPMSSGVGGDSFALVWHDGELDGLDAAGPAPAGAQPLEPVAERGPSSVTVPGAVAGWAALVERFGRLRLDSCLADAIDAAEGGFAVTAHVASAWKAGPDTAAAWAVANVPPEFDPPPSMGQRVRFPELAATLRAIADVGPQALYRGRIAEAICTASWLAEEDLEAFVPRWVEPLRVSYRGYQVAELPPPNQGIAALEGLALLQGLEPTLANQIHCAGLALDDALVHVRDGADVGALLDAAYVDQRRHDVPRAVAEPAGGTSYLCVVDEDRMAVSLIQSLYSAFGSGIVAPGTGVVLQNRGAGFGLQGRVEPGKRPYHTNIPGLLLRDGMLVGPFGVMGGFIQAQAHIQLVSGLIDDELDPQAALDRPRFWIDNTLVRLEEGLWDRADELERAGFRVICDSDRFGFGAGQAIIVAGEALLGGSDARKDGHAAGF